MYNLNFFLETHYFPFPCVIICTLHLLGRVPWCFEKCCVNNKLAIPIHLVLFMLFEIIRWTRGPLLPVSIAV